MMNRQRAKTKTDRRKPGSRREIGREGKRRARARAREGIDGRGREGT